MIRSRKLRYRLESRINLETLNELILTYLSLNKNDTIRNLKSIRNKYQDKTLSMFVNIIRAINNRKVLEIEYGRNSFGETIRREVTPVNVIRAQRNIYLLGFEGDDFKEVRSYLLEKLENIIVTSKKPAIEDYPESAGIFRFSWGTYIGGEKKYVRLLFPAKFSDYFNNKFFMEEQGVSVCPEGVILEFKVKISYEFISWVMGWGENVKILQPDELKEKVIKRAEGLLKQNKNFII
jgi:predicted DNA-binding transcriptional regulator YafY